MSLRRSRREEPSEPAAIPHEQPTEQPTQQPPAPERTRDWRALAAENWRALAAVAFLVLGIVFVILAWIGTAYTNLVYKQIPYVVSGGLLGLGLIIVAGFLASSASADRTAHALRRDLRALAAQIGTGTPAEGIPSVASANGRVLVVPGGRSYHVAGCPIVEGKEGVREMAPAQAIGSGLTACKLCGPD